MSIPSPSSSAFSTVKYVDLQPQTIKLEEQTESSKEEEGKMVSNSNDLTQQTINESAVRVKQLQFNFIGNTIESNPFVIEAKEVENMTKSLGITKEELLQKLIPFAQPLARAPISNYQVGVAGLGKSGNIYLGVNLEFRGCPLNEAVHGEQCLVANAKNQGETELIAMALSAAPCGHCRQFLNELGQSSLRLLIPNQEPMELSSLLPQPFGPKDLGIKGTLLTPRSPFKSNHADPLVAKAIEAAHSSYAPYSSSLSGVAIKTKGGNIYSGSHLENAAFNPSLAPLQSALVACVTGKEKYDDIVEVVLVEQQSAKISHLTTTKMILEAIAPHATFHLEKLNELK